MRALSVTLDTTIIRKVGLCSLIKRFSDLGDGDNPVYEVFLEGEGVMHRSSRLGDASTYFHMLLGEEDQLPTDNG